MALEQMICFVTPGAPDQVPQSVMRRIDAMCQKIGRVHFATLALLPPAPEACAPALASLMLEIVVDEDLAPADLIELMLDTAFATLWQLYKPNWNGPRNADPGTKRTWLRAFLAEHAYPADGGFVGARDRSVAQVRAEERLFMKARAALHALPKAQRPPTPRELALHMVNWARTHGFCWVADPAPRSRWRKGPDFGWMDWMALAAKLVVPVPAFIGLLMSLGFVVLAGAWLLDGVMPVPRDAGAVVVLAALAVFVALLLPLMLASATGLGLLQLAFQTCLYLLLALPFVGLGAYRAVEAESLAWPNCSATLGLLGLLSVLAVGAAALVAGLVPLLLALRAPPWFPLLAVLGTMGFMGGLAWVFGRLMVAAMLGVAQCGYPDWKAVPPSGADERLAWAMAALLAVAAVVVFAVFFASRRTRRPNLADRLNQPDPLPPLPAHQVHCSIQACEAALAARTSHMISLTEIRRPYFLYRNLLRFWLWSISKLGEYVFTEGVLGNARGIKFGHWHIIGGGKRLLFCSNFDSAFGGYLDEFILGASEGINLIWGNSELRVRGAARWDQPGVQLPRPFPPTRFLIYKGCKAEQNFKAYVRASMLPHLHRFEAYCLSNEDIERGTRLREALRGTRTALKDDQIARALES